MKEMEYKIDKDLKGNLKKSSGLKWHNHPLVQWSPTFSALWTGDRGGREVGSTRVVGKHTCVQLHLHKQQAPAPTVRTSGSCARVLTHCFCGSVLNGPQPYSGPLL